MSTHFILTKNLRDPLPSILESLTERHIAHRLVDDFLILTPNFESSQDVIESLLQNKKLGGVLTGSTILSVEEWVEKQAADLSSQTLKSPPWIREILFESLIQNFKFPQEEIKNKILENQFSSKTLYHLIQSFREELLTEKELFSFVSQFDPLLAEICTDLFIRYQETLRTYPFLGDSALQVELILKTLLKKEFYSLKPIKTIYWLGFPYLSSTHRKLIEAIEANYDLEQIVLLQSPEKKEAQDFLSLTWGESLPSYSEIKNLKEDSCQKNLFSFSTPFEEAGFILSTIHQKILEGIPSDSIGIFLSRDPFWRSYFSRELKKMGVLNDSFFEKNLLSFSTISKNIGSSLEKTIQKTKKTIEQQQKQFSQTKSEETSLELRASFQWLKTLEEISFYQNEVPLFQKQKFPLQKIASQIFIESKTPSRSGIALRSFHQSGFKNFKIGFIFNCSETSFPETPTRFFGFQLPHSRKNPIAQRSLFQHLIDSAEESLYLTYSTHTAQGEENSFSPLCTEFGLGEFDFRYHFPVYLSERESSNFKERVESEMLRKSSPNSDHLYGGKIESSKTLSLLQKKMKEHLYTPRQFEEYAICPFRFFTSTLLKIQPPLEKSEEPSPLEKGTWIHDFLEVFFSKHLKKIFDAKNSSLLQKEVFSNLKNEFLDFSSAFLKDHPWIHEILSNHFILKTEVALQSLIEDFWKRSNESKNPLLPTHFESKFDRDDETLLIFEKENLPSLKIRGRIDRIDQTETKEEFIVLDYKTGNAQETTKQILQFKSFQLPLYLLAAEKILSKDVIPAKAGIPQVHTGDPRQKHSGMTNREIPLRGKGALILDLKEIKTNQGIFHKEAAVRFGFSTRSKAFLEDDAWNDYWLKLKEKLLEIHEKIYSGDFRVNPDPCDPYCHSRTICRYHELGR